MKPFHRRSILQDVVDLAPNLRYADKREILARSGHSAEQALTLAYLESGIYCRSILDNYGKVVGMFGIVPKTETSALIWMLGSDGLLKIVKPFLRECRTVVNGFNELYPHLYNIIDSRNLVHLKWLRWCGFSILQPHIINDVKFYEFARIKT
jgi:hypothetical protein